ncbi:MAG: gor, partial [Caulobacteraceae bacterium]|nr:gor [Caulobacteraceae bacterium]
MAAPKYDYDLLVIGAGSGGVRAARLAAMSGATVAVVESGMVGGTCVIRGCVPKKLMVYASEFAHHAKVAEAYGWSPSTATFDWKKFINAKDLEIARLSGAYVANLHKAGAQLLHGKASFVDAHTIKIEGEDARTVTAEKVLIAVGGKPVCPPDLEGSEGIITSNEAFHLPELPKSILIVGGGYIAVEFAGIFNGLGSKVALLVRGPNILRGFDDDVRAHLSGELTKRGIDVIVGHQLEKIEKTTDGQVKATVSAGHERLVDYVMFATGRKPLIDGLNLEAAGVTLNEAGAVVVDDHSRTNVANIWAVGDVTDRINLTPVALMEGH